MKTHRLLVAVLLAVVFYSCYEEEEVVAEIVPYKRTSWYDTTSTDRIVKFVSEYYYKYDRFFITDPDSSDYWYNFQSKYDELQVELPEQDDEHLWNGCEYVQTLLLDFYEADFIRAHFPYSIILVDNVADQLLGLPVDYFLGRYFGMVAIKDMGDLGVEEKKTYSAKLHEMVWGYIGLYDSSLGLPNEFYRFGEGSYDTQDWSGELTSEQLYEKGFTHNKVAGWGFTWFPSKGEDIGYWMNFLITTPDDELEEILATHEAMRVKYDHLVQALGRMNVDYKKLRYTE